MPVGMAVNAGNWPKQLKFVPLVVHAAAAGPTSSPPTKTASRATNKS